MRNHFAEQRHVVSVGRRGDVRGSRVPPEGIARSELHELTRFKTGCGSAFQIVDHGIAQCRQTLDIPVARHILQPLGNQGQQGFPRAQAVG